MDYAVIRELNSLYIFLDIGFLLLLGIFLWYTKRKQAFWFGVIGALLYFIVDYGGFYLFLGTREVTGANTMWFLLWLSTSYGFTNFAWIWLFLDRDKDIVKWSAIILGGWLIVAFLSQGFGTSFQSITISRMTGSYHWFMFIILIVGYLFLIIKDWNDPNLWKRLIYLLIVGVVVQLSWESVLLVSGIRPFGLNPILFNSLLETNLGMPYLYLIHKAFTKKQELIVKDL